VTDLAALFKLETAAAEQLVNGQIRRVKSNCTKASALQYRTALTGIGLGVNVQRHPTTPGPDDKSINQQANDAKTTERSARARSVLDSLLPPASSSNKATSDHEATAPQASHAPATPEQLAHISAAQNAAPGEQAKFESFTPGDKPIPFEPTGKPEKRLIETLTIAPVGATMAEHVEQRPYVLVTPPDFEVAPAGEPIPTLQTPVQPLKPSTDHLHLEPISREGDT